MTSSATDERATLEHWLDLQRAEIAGLLDDVSEEQARARLVPSLTTLIGLVAHATFVERVWFHHRVAGVPRSTLGLPDTVDESFMVPAETSPSAVRAAFLEACDGSRRIAADHRDLDETFTWHNREISLRQIHVHLIAELARHAGHGDILREQVLAGARRG